MLTRQRCLPGSRAGGRTSPTGIPDEPTVLAEEEVERPVATRIRLLDVTDQTGITFVHTNGSQGKHYIVEAMSAGLALFDYDLDGDEDIYFPNGAPLQYPRHEGSSPQSFAESRTPANALYRPANALYRNEGNWKFTDVTEQAGVGDTGFGLGVTVGDYNNDGYPDLYITNFGPNLLYRNNGDGTFTDVTREAGVGDGNKVGAGASFLDIDADGDLDLYVANYVKFSYASHRPTMIRGKAFYPGPLEHTPEADTLYRNLGDGTFLDISELANLPDRVRTGMGITACDYDGDGDTDLYVANDEMANMLLQNDGKGAFKEVGVLSGVAYDLTGMPQGSMGVDVADYDNDGLLDVHVTSYDGEIASLYRNLGKGLFQDITRLTGAGLGTLGDVTWGNGWVDFDQDGDRDLFIACGHTESNIDQVRLSTSYEACNLLLLNCQEGARKGRFVNVTQGSGSGMSVRKCSRGAAFGDLDQDGDIDVVVLNSRSGPTLLRNDTANGNHWLQLKLQGTTSNRAGIGARVRVRAGPLVQVDEVHSGRGYQSHWGTRLHFGLGQQTHIDRIEVTWLGGKRDMLENIEVDQCLTIVEGRTSPSTRR